MLTVPAGTTVAEMVERALPGLAGDAHKAVRVTIGDYEVPPALWQRARPKSGMSVILRVVPADGNVRSVLSVAVLIAATLAAPQLAPAFLVSAFGATAATAVTAIALTTASTLLLNALVPLKPPGALGQRGQQGQSFAIQGFQNAFSPGGVVPDVLGFHRFAPPYATLPYTVSDSDNNQYIVAVFNFGYGPVAIDNIRLGEASIDNFEDVDVEIREGYPDDEPLTLFTVRSGAAVRDPSNVGNGAPLFVEATGVTAVGDYTIVMSSATAFEVFRPDTTSDGTGTAGTPYLGQLSFILTAGFIAFVSGDNWTITTVYRREQVLEDSQTLELKAPQLVDKVSTAQPQVRTTARDVAGAGIELFFPGGLYNGTSNRTVDILIRYRAVGDVSWTAVDFGIGYTFSFGLGHINVTSNSREPLRVARRWTFPDRGQYDIEITRITAEVPTDTDLVDDFVLSAVRGFRPEYPIAFDRPLALVAVRVKATEQLSGMIDNLNADVQRICPDWDSGTETWITRASDNPASLYRYVLQSNANAYPKTDEEINLEALADWHEYCTAKGLRYDRPHDGDASLWDVLTDVAAAGRASPRDDGTQWTVVIDRPQDTIVGHISPRNSWGFSGERSYTRFPDAFRVTFPDETNGYQTAERVVLWPGFEGEPDITEEISLPGITDPDLIFTEARRRQYELIHRPDRYTVNQDWEALVMTRGDLARLSHDVLDRVQTAARVKSVSGDDVTFDTLLTIEAATGYAVRFRLADGTSLLKLVDSPTPGETDTLTLETGDMPEPGDLGFFGVAGEESREVIVLGIENGDNLTARLALVDHAPQIETLLEADEIPAWNRRAGAIVTALDFSSAQNSQYQMMGWI